MSYKYFVVSDVHGHYDLLKETLDKFGFDSSNPNHIFVSLGDLFDRGKQSYECLKFVNSLDESRKILLAGNHELMLEDILIDGCLQDVDYYNGSDETIRSLCKLEDVTIDSNAKEDLNYAIEEISKSEQLNQYLSSLSYFYETKKYVFVHGWIPYDEKNCSYNPNWREADSWAFEKATWTNCFDAWKSGIKEPNKTIVAGHFHTSYGHSVLHQLGSSFGPDAHYEIFQDEGIIGLDALTIVSKKMNCLVVEDEEE